MKRNAVMYATFLIGRGQENAIARAIVQRKMRKRPNAVKGIGKVLSIGIGIPFFIFLYLIWILAF